MNTSLWKRLFRLGVGEDIDFRLERRIILSNQFAFVILVLTLFFMVAFAGRDNYSIIPFVVMILISSAIWILNFAGLTKLSRMITCLTPAIGLLILNISQKFGDAAAVDILQYATPRMLILGSIVIPFTMFIPRERGYVITGIVIILGIAFGYDLIHQLAGVDYKSVGLKSDHYGIIYEDLTVLAIMILLSSGFMFNLGNKYDQKTQRRLDEALQQANQLKQKDEAMQQTLKELEESRKKDEERNWVSKGLAEMIAILQSGDEMEKIFDKLVSKLVLYMNLNQGALFIAQENESNETVLKLISCFAYNRKKHIEIAVDSGEGLLGQVFMEGEISYLKNIPDNHLKITSGLGEATPSHLVIVPMKVNNKVEGIMELASFTPIEQRHIDLLEQLGENMASYIANNRVNARTKTLLEQAQTMSAEMRENEEEMRQNLEELQATQEALARKEKEYQQRIEELENELRLEKKLSRKTV